MSLSRPIQWYHSHADLIKENPLQEACSDFQIAAYDSKNCLKIRH